MKQVGRNKIRKRGQISSPIYNRKGKLHEANMITRETKKTYAHAYTHMDKQGNTYDRI